MNDLQPFRGCVCEREICVHASEISVHGDRNTHAHGLAEINTRVRTDTALQRAFGRESCAEQSVVQETLSACTAENVAHNVTLSSCYQGDPRDTNTCLSDTSRAGSVELLPQPDSRTDGAYDTEFVHVTGNINHAGLPPITGLPHP